VSSTAGDREQQAGNAKAVVVLLVVVYLVAYIVRLEQEGHAKEDVGHERGKRGMRG